MKITLVIRTYNEEENIGGCLSAVFLQTRIPDEVLIVDANSTDKTLKIVKEYQDKLPIRIIHNSERTYISGLNIGAKEAQYDLLGFLSADCFPKKNWMKELEKVMMENDSVVVMGQEVVKGNDDIHFVISKTRKQSDKNKIIKFFENSNILYNKEILKKLLPFTGIGTKRGGEDTLLSIQFAKKGYKIMKASGAIVEHNIYDSMEDFKDRTIQQGERLSEFFKYDFRYPRTYLNPFYWSIVEFFTFFRYFDKRFLHISWLRFKYIMLGIKKSRKSKVESLKV